MLNSGAHLCTVWPELRLAAAGLGIGLGQQCVDIHRVGAEREAKRRKEKEKRRDGDEKGRGEKRKRRGEGVKRKEEMEEQKKETKQVMQDTKKRRKTKSEAVV